VVHRDRLLGLLLILNGSMVAATAMVKEREAGTIEQLLMSPAERTKLSSRRLRRCSFCSS